MSIFPGEQTRNLMRATLTARDRHIATLKEHLTAKDRRIAELEEALRQILEWPGCFTDAVAGDANPREIAGGVLDGES